MDAKGEPCVHALCLRPLSCVVNVSRAPRRNEFHQDTYKEKRQIAGRVTDGQTQTMGKKTTWLTKVKLSELFQVPKILFQTI